MVFCAVSGFVFEMSVYCTVGFIFLASADRFLGVYHPIFHRKYLCRQNLIKLVSDFVFISDLNPKLKQNVDHSSSFGCFIFIIHT